MRCSLRPRIAIGDVVLDRGREQERVLLHHADRAAQRLQRHLADVLPVDGDRARRSRRRSAGSDARWSTCRCPAGRRCRWSRRALASKLMSRQRRVLPVAGIGKPTLSKRSTPSVTTRSLAPGASLIVGLEVEQLEQPRAAGRGAREGVDHQAELAHRHLQDRHEGEERGERADADLAGDAPCRRRPRARGPWRRRTRSSWRWCC